MAELPRIRTPWKQQWRRIRYQLLPVVTMACCAVASAWLWNRRMGAITTFGEVELQHTSVVSTLTGHLVPSPGVRQLKLFDRVSAGEMVAKLDDGPALAALDLLRKELARLQTDLRAKEEEIRLADQDRKQSQMVEARRLAILVDDVRLRLIDRRAALEVERIEYQRQKTLYDMIRNAGSAASEKERLELQLARDAAEQRVRNNEDALRQAEAQLKEAMQRASALPEAATTEAQKLLEPIRAGIAAQQAKIEEIELRNKALCIYAPTSGYVSAIHRRPGDAVMAGESIITLVNDQCDHIVSYVRQEHRVKPSTEMFVEIRSRIDGGRPVRAAVTKVGNFYEQIPTHQARDPKIIEWGVPVLISIPPELDSKLKPGELVEVRFGPGRMLGTH
ncbi:MAG: HlyD family secretion protein [Bacillota bacterium]